jgi:hypothetical protein
MARTKPSATRRRSESASTIIIVVDREGRVFLLFRLAAAVRGSAAKTGD